MKDILTSIFYDDFLRPQGKDVLKPPYTPAEASLCEWLEKLDAHTAGELERDIKMIAIEQRDQAFYNGARFGAQLITELLNSN